MQRTDLRFVAALLVVSVGVRLVVVERSQWMTEGDEALVGVMALQILEGDRPVFFNGQPYMGAFQAYLAALLFAQLGVSGVVLKLVPLLGAVAFVLATYLLARQIVSPWAARAAGLIAATPPLYVLANTSKAWAPHLEVMALGTFAVLISIRLRWGSPAPIEPLILGALAGFAFWLHPFAAYYLIVCGVILCSGNLGQFLARVPALALGASLGALPLWAANVANGYQTLRYLASGDASQTDDAAVAEYLLTSGLPRVLGWWQPWGVIPPGVALALAFTTVTGLCALAWRGRRTHGWRLAPTDSPLLLAIVIPLMFIFSGFGGASQNPWGFDATGRYLLPLWGVVPLAVAMLIDAVQRQRRVAEAMVALVIGAHAVGYATADPRQVFQSPYWNRLPTQSTSLQEYLVAQGITHVWMNHWAGFPLMLHTQGEVIAADYYDVVVGGGINRFPGHLVALEQAERAAYVLVTDEPRAPLENRLDELGVTYRGVRLGPYLLIQPLSRRVQPWEVVDALGYQY